MNIAIIFSDAKTSIGGGLSYQIKLAKLIKENFNQNIYFFSNDQSIERELTKYGIDISYLNYNIFNKLLFKISKIKFFKFINFFYKFNLDKKFLKKDIDLVYFLSPNSDSLYLENINYIFTVWDLCHRDHPEFPEVRNNLAFEKREILFNKILPFATKVISESSFGKQQLIKRYNIDNEKCEIIDMPLSYLSGEDTNLDNSFIDNTINKYHIKNKFIFYPAQLWAHKNHIYNIDAIKYLAKKEIIIDLVFCGADKGNLKTIMAYAKKNNVEKQVKYLGYIDKKEITALYKASLALSMPTYFGPTNIPPLEAFRNSTPVLYPIFDSENKLFNNGIWPIDLKDPKTLSLQIEKILKNDIAIEEKIEYGKKFLESNNDEKIIKCLKNIFNEFEIKKKTWKI